MPVRRLHADSDPVDVAEAIVQAHPSLLSPNLVSAAQVERLIGRLVEHKQQQQLLNVEQPEAQKQQAKLPATTSHYRGAGPSSLAASAITSLPRRGAEQPHLDAARGVRDGGDLNAASEAELAAAKAEMQMTFERNSLRPGDTGYVHDKRLDAPDAVRACVLCTTHRSTCALLVGCPPPQDTVAWRRGSASCCNARFFVVAVQVESNEWDDEIEDFETDDEDDLLRDLLSNS